MQYIIAGLFVLAGLGLGLILFALIAGLLILAFEIWMFVDLIQNERVTQDQKVLWAIGMFLLHPFVAMAYYFYTRHGSGAPR